MTTLLPADTSNEIDSDLREAAAEIDRANVPHHIAIVMDGNRRWARHQGLPITMGHAMGAEKLIEMTKIASSIGVRVLTVYGFSTENWMRSEQEVTALLELIKEYVVSQKEVMLQAGIRMHTIGNMDHFPKDMIKALNDTKQATQNGKHFDLVLALNYGSRNEICRAVQSVIEDDRSGKIKTTTLTEQQFASYLDTAAWPDPELLIRTSGELRVSNFLLWQIAYTEICIVDVTWPEFSKTHFLEAIKEFQTRDRRLGG